MRRSTDAPLDDADNPALRDVDFIRNWAAPTLDLVSQYYFRCTYRGTENVPQHGNFLCVSNHSGGPLLPDVFMMVSQWWKQFGTDPLAYALIHDGPFHIPVLRDYLAKIGGLRASPENGERVLGMGGTLLVYPGGEQEVMRSYRQRNRINFRGRTGFVELALRTGVPILPVVSIGGHEVYMTLFSSQVIAKMLRLDRLIGVRTFTVNAGLPWGIWPTSLVPYWPLPAKITFQAGKPFYLPKDPDKAHDRKFVAEVYTEVTHEMQRMVDELAEERRLPVLG